MILPRIITAIIGIPVVLFFIYCGGFPFYLFVSFIIVMCNYEYYIIMRNALRPVQPFALFICSVLFPIAFFMNGSDFNIYNFLPFIISLSIILPFVLELFSKEKYLERVSYTIIGIFLISFNLSYLILIRDIPQYGRTIILLVILCVWIGDSAAYFIGTRFGKRKLNDISPKKTVEGFFASVLFSILFFYILSKYSQMFTLSQFIYLAIIISIAGQISDLAQSLIKRACSIKDSSNLLPGHGGFFDRFDSYLFLSPFVYYFVVFVK